MPMEEIIDYEAPKLKVYKVNAMWLATFLGGPLAAGYIFTQNYKAMGEARLARISLTITLVVSSLLFSIALFVPEGSILSSRFLPILTVIIAQSLCKRLQGAKLESYATDASMYFGWGRVFLISVIGLLLTFAIFLIVLYLMGEI